MRNASNNGGGLRGRRAWLHGNVSGASALRPPWSIAEDAFTSRCSRCDACRDACPQRIVVRGDGGFPEIDFARGACDFCGKCALVCRDAAIVRPARPGASRPWLLVAHLGPACLAIAGVECRNCGDACATHAIRFRMRVGGGARPELDAAACTGCGACSATCPVQAITFATVNPTESFA